MEFKVNDIVLNKTRNAIYILRFEDLIRFDDEDLVLWEPKSGEYCWFRANKHSDITFGQFVSKVNGIYYARNHTSNDNRFEYCEPFIGTLPKFRIRNST